MQCGEVRQFISAGSLPTESVAVRDHLTNCDLCWQFFEDANLEASLAALGEAPAPDPEFVNRAVARAIQEGATASRPPIAAISAIAASLVLAVAVLFSVNANDPQLSQQLAQQNPPMDTSYLDATFGEHKSVNVVIYSKESQDDAIVAVELLGDVELDGYPGEAKLVWNTKLVKGANLLKLPVNIIGVDGGSVSVTSVYGGQSKRVDVLVVEASPKKDLTHAPLPHADKYSLLNKLRGRDRV